MKFNKKRLMDNLIRLIKQSDLKMKDVEEQLGMSTGYMSRIARADNDLNLTIEQVAKLSDLLNVSIDALLVQDYTDSNSNIDLVNRFIQQLIADTDEHKLVWEPVTGAVKDAFSTPMMLDCDPSIEEPHPLFHSLMIDSVFLFVEAFVLISEEFGYLFLFKLLYEGDSESFNGYELYQLPDDRTDEYLPVASSFINAGVSAKLLESLFMSILHHERDIKLAVSTRESIVNYLRKAAEQ